MERFRLINEIISGKGLKKYLEIGVSDPDGCFNIIECETKHGVDPGIEVPVGAAVTFQKTSDDFFQSLEANRIEGLEREYKWDAIFIDGLHFADQVERDIRNAYRHLSHDGYIVLHDCNPPSYWHAREDYAFRDTPAGQMWNGTTWKAIQKLRQGKIITNSIDVVTMHEDWGVTVLRRGAGIETYDPTYNEFYEFYLFDIQRREILNLVDDEGFTRWLASR